jgi:Na+/proline symporter
MTIHRSHTEASAPRHLSVCGLFWIAYFLVLAIVVWWLAS